MQYIERTTLTQTWLSRGQWALALAFLLAACGGNNSGNSSNDRGADEGGASGAGDGAGGSAGEAGGKAGSDGGNGGSVTGGAGGRGGSGTGTGGAGTGGAGTGGAGTGGAATGGTGTGGTAGMGGTSATGPQPSAAAMFFKTSCAECHGDAGEGTKLGPELQHPVRDFATWVIRTGRQHPVYPKPMKAVSEAVLNADLLGGIFAMLDAVPKPKDGKGLYLDYCGNCHGADGKGTLVKHPLGMKSATDFINNVRKGHHQGEFVKRTSYMPKWSAAQLSDAEIRLMQTYVAGL